MIRYRHWVEMRLGVLVFAVLCLWFGVVVSGPWHSLEYGQALPLTPLGQAIGANEVLVWAEFAGRILPFSLAASLALSGAGFRTFFMPVAPVVYMLTLPISRTRLVWTRLAAGLGVACAGATVLTAGGVIWFTMRGQSVPIAAVLQSLALGVVLLAAMLAIMSAVITALPTAWAFLGILGAVGPRHSEQLRRLRPGARRRAVAGRRRLRWWRWSPRRRSRCATSGPGRY